MAAFCKQCSIEYFGKDFRDLAEISTKANTDDQLFATVICEGCGVVQVDHDGVCISDDCDKKHGLRDEGDEIADQADARV